MTYNFMNTDSKNHKIICHIEIQKSLISNVGDEGPGPGSSLRLHLTFHYDFIT